MKINILILSEAITGGEWIATKRLITEVKKNHSNYKFHIMVFSKKNIHEPDFQSTTIIKYSKSKKPFIFFKRLIEDFTNSRLEIKNFLKTEKINYMISTYYLMHLAAIGVSSKNTKKIFYFHGVRSTFFKSVSDLNYRQIIVKFLERFALLKADIIIVPSKFSKSYVLKLLGPFVNKNKISIVPNFVPKSFSQKISSRSIILLKKKYSIKKDKKIILYCGRIGRYKGLENLIEAFKGFLKYHKSAVLVIASPSYSMDMEVYKAIINKVSKYKIDKDVRLMFELKNNLLPSLYKLSDVLVLPSELENAPLSVLEALSCGTPVLSTPVGNVPKILRKIDPSLILQDNSPYEILRGLNYFFGVSKERLRKTKQNEELVAKNFSPKISVEAFLQVLGH